jgi:hypothetical protein
VALAVIAVGVTPASAAVTGVAGCDKDTFAGSDDWRRDSVAAGPVGISDARLTQMSRTRNGQFLAKRPLLVDSGGRAVMVSVPKRLRGRVFLYYGRWQDRQGEPTRAFRNARGFDAITFTPCERCAPTVWPGGLRVKGRGPVHLRVEVEGRDHPLTLVLGRPSTGPDRRVRGRPAG